MTCTNKRNIEKGNELELDEFIHIKKLADG